MTRFHPRPAHQHGRQRRPTRAIDPRLRPQFFQTHRTAIGLWDERLSTVAVERELIDIDMSRAKRAKVIDEHAAIFILQGALDRLTVLNRS